MERTQEEVIKIFEEKQATAERELERVRAKDCTQIEKDTKIIKNKAYTEAYEDCIAFLRGCTIVEKKEPKHFVCPPSQDELKTKLQYNKWYDINEYFNNLDEMDWALVQFKETETNFYPLPIVAEFNKRDRVWVTETEKDRYLCEMCEPVAFMLWQPYGQYKDMVKLSEMPHEETIESTIPKAEQEDLKKMVDEDKPKLKVCDMEAEVERLYKTNTALVTELNHCKETIVELANEVTTMRRIERDRGYEK